MSVVPTAASHPFTMDIKEGRILRFTFADIMLPDSNINEPLSHGFVKFRISQIPDLPPGVDIRNRVGIYFDFNTPILTNEVHLVTTTVSGTETPLATSTVTAYPNPFDQKLLFEVNCRDCAEEKRINLFDVMGRLVQTEVFAGGRHQVTTAALQTGVYFYVVLEKGRVIGRGKVVKG